MTTFPESHKDLLDGQVASLTTIGADGYPQSTITWFLHDDGELKLSLSSSRLKTKNLRRRPQVSLLIFDPSNAFKYLAVRGDAVVAADPGGAFATKVGAKYGANLADYDEPGDERVVVTIKPTNVYAVDMSG